MATNHNNKLSASSSKLAFQTNGQTADNSLATPITADESSLRVVYDNSTSSTYLSYACTQTQASTGTHSVKWSFNPNHNTKGYIRNDGFKVEVVGAGSSASNRISAYGGKVALRFSGFSYTGASNIAVRRTVNYTTYYKFPAKPSNYELGTGQREIYDTRTIYQSEHNTPNPEYWVRMTSDATYLSGYSTASNNFVSSQDSYYKIKVNQSSFGNNNTTFVTNSGVDSAYISSNIGNVKKGTCSGSFFVTTSGSASSSGSTTTITVKSNDLSITRADNSQAQTPDRVAHLTFTPQNGLTDSSNDRYGFSSWTNMSNVVVPIYQSGGNLTTPDPTVTCILNKASTTFGTWDAANMGLFTSKNDSFSMKFNWNSNLGTQGSVGGTLKVTPDKATQALCTTYLYGSSSNWAILCKDNLGSTINLEITGHTFTAPTNTQSRSIQGTIDFECINDENGSAGKLARTSIDYSISQDGKYNPSPSFSLRSSLSPSSSNADPSANLTATFNGAPFTLGSTMSINSTSTQTLSIKVPSTMPGVTGASTTDKISIIGSKAYNFGSSPAEQNISINFNYAVSDFTSGHVVAHGENGWMLTIRNPVTPNGVYNNISLRPGINSDPTDFIGILIKQPGNSRMDNGTYETVTITAEATPTSGNKALVSVGTRNNGNNYITITRSGNALVTGPTIGLSSIGNKASITKVSLQWNDAAKSMTVTSDGVNTSTQSGTIKFTKSKGKMKFDGDPDSAAATSVSAFYSVAGEQYGGKVSIRAVKNGTGEGTVTGTDIDLEKTNTGIKPYTITNPTGSIKNDTKIQGKSNGVIYVGFSQGSTDITLSNPTVTKATASTWNLYATISGTINSSLNGTYPAGTRSSDGYVGSVSTTPNNPTIDSDAFYHWFNPQTTEIGKQVSLSGTKTITISYPSNPLNSNNGTDTKTEYFGSGYWVRVTGGWSTKFDERTLGTLKVAYGTTSESNASDSVTIKQRGSSGGAISNSGTFNFTFINCKGTVGDSKTPSTSGSAKLSSEDNNSPDSVNGSITEAVWNNYDYNTDFYLTRGTTYNATCPKIGSYGSAITHTMGRTRIEGILSYGYKVTCDGHDLDGGLSTLAISDPTIVCTWNDGDFDGPTRDITLYNNKPGMYVYILKTIKGTYKFTDKFADEDVELSDIVDITDVTWIYNIKNTFFLRYGTAYTVDDTMIGAFDSDQTHKIGLTGADAMMTYEYEASCDGTKIGSDSNTINTNVTVTAKWSDSTTPLDGVSRDITIYHDKPGTYTYTLESISATYGSYTKTETINKTWTFTVDSKHYYNV